MNLYIADNGTALDLEHVMAVGAVFEDFMSSPCYIYRLTLTFGSDLSIGYFSKEAAVECRRKLILAWQKSA